MKIPFRKLMLSVLLLSAAHAHAETPLVVSAALGSASIDNISGFGSAALARLDGTLYPFPAIGINAFYAGYGDFKTGSGNEVAIRIRGYGAGVTGRWAARPHIQPYLRLEYMQWNAEASGVGRTLGTDKGGSPGFAAGVDFPVNESFGIKAEMAGYNNVSDADIRQFVFSLTYAF